MEFIIFHFMKKKQQIFFVGNFTNKNECQVVEKFSSVMPAKAQTCVFCCT